MKKFFICLLSFSFFHLQAQQKLTVFADKIVAPVSPTMWGVFFEDINFGADGGLYAEMIKNRSFEFEYPMTGWKEIRKNGTGKILIQNTSGVRDARYAELTINATAGSYGMANEGFRGMGFQKGETYHFAITVKRNSGDAKLRVEAVNGAGQKIGEAVLDKISDGWQTHKLSFTTTDTAMKGKLNVWFEGSGEVAVKRVSLFPEHTWKKRENGMRADLVQLLADMKPGFLRFPGGCIVEGRDLTNRYQWKATVGPVDTRKTLVNRWNMEFRHKPTPDYYQSFGLGFFEYFQLSEDIGAEPLPILNCGMACQFNSGEVVALNELDPYIQDALDLIEFANAPVTTTWGKLRAQMGHPAPFNLKYIGIGNEQWDEQYIERYKLFHAVLKQKLPEVKIISSVGPSPDGKLFDYAWKELRALNADIVDEHYYATPDWFLKNASRYDTYDRKGPKIFAGEYAAQSKGIASADNRNNWQCALSEAAFMTGLERNGDVISMASYAPLFAHVDAWQWTPDLIWFDNLRSYGTPNYYVQKLFALNRGTHLVPVVNEGTVLNGKDSLYASAVLDEVNKTVIIKVVNAGSAQASISLHLQGAKSLEKETTIETLAAIDNQAVNSLADPKAISPTKKALSGRDKLIAIQPLSMNVITIPIQ